MQRLLFWSLIFVLIIGLVYSLLFGSLLFLNPIKLGLRSKKLPNATIYTSNIYELNPIYDYVNEHMIEAEMLYQLKYNQKVQIYVATSTDEFKRWIPPWINGNVGGISLYVGNAIFINPEPIRKNNYSEEEFIKHELIHNLIAQNSALLNNFVFDSHEWMNEGTAMYFGGPNYMNENEFRTMMRNATLIHDDKSSKLFSNLEDKDYKFKMSIYKYFIAFLITEYGDTRFTNYMNQYINSPNNYKILFYEVYNKPIKLVIEEFKKTYGAK